MDPHSVPDEYCDREPIDDWDADESGWALEQIYGEARCFADLDDREHETRQLWSIIELALDRLAELEPHGLLGRVTTMVAAATHSAKEA